MFSVAYEEVVVKTLGINIVPDITTLVTIENLTDNDSEDHILPISKGGREGRCARRTAFVNHLMLK